MWAHNEFNVLLVFSDFIDVYLAEVKKTTDPNSVFYGDFAGMLLTASSAEPSLQFI